MADCTKEMTRIDGKIRHENIKENLKDHQTKRKDQGTLSKMVKPIGWPKTV